MSGYTCTYIYCGPNSGELATIGDVHNGGSGDPRATACILEGVFTTDLEQAERWRSTLATGKLPDLDADPPICDEDQVSARIDEIEIESIL